MQIEQVETSQFNPHTHKSGRINEENLAQRKTALEIWPCSAVGHQSGWHINSLHHQLHALKDRGRRISQRLAGT
jgi:tRNA 2-selenouridine synthase SelU